MSTRYSAFGDSIHMRCPDERGFMSNFLEEFERERRVLLTEISNDPDALSTTHRPGTVRMRPNPSEDSDHDYFICPGCGTELYSSYVHAWEGIPCESCSCNFSAVDEDAQLWDFNKLPRETETIK
jgi:hypothetical protein